MPHPIHKKIEFESRELNSIPFISHFNLLTLETSVPEKYAAKSQHALKMCQGDFLGNFAFHSLTKAGSASHTHSWPVGQMFVHPLPSLPVLMRNTIF